MVFMRISTLACFCGAACMAQENPFFQDRESMGYLETLAGAVLEASRVPNGASVAGQPPNTTGNTLIRPGGRNAYPAFWIRDYAMSLDAELITPDEQRHALRVAAGHQIDVSRILPSGSLLPPGSIPDHVAFDNTPIFFPGVLGDYAAQGGKTWGMLPCLDDQFFLIHMAAQYATQTEDTAFLHEAVRGKTLLERLEAAYAMPPANPENGLVQATEAVRGVNFGFFDTVTHTGDLFFCSLLKFRAARELAGLLDALGQAEHASRYRGEAERIALALKPVFALDNGWFRASTGRSAQPDVWGTAFAVYCGALPPDVELRACQALAQALRESTIAWNGAIRQVPVGLDFSTDSAWEQCLAKKNQYQNGAYWTTATGWTAYAVAKVDLNLARQLALDYVRQLREDDFRKGEAFGSPWECMHPEGKHRQNPIYLTSITEPLAAFRRIERDICSAK